MNKNIFFSLLFLGLLGLMSCVEYPEGPQFSPWPVNLRVINTWVWGYALENEENLTGIMADSTIQFRDDNVLLICDLNDNCREGRWNLVRKKTKLQMVFGDVATAYEIRLLRKDEMWLFYEDPDTKDVIEWELVPK
ncbi:MAG: hypothetical protein AAF587_25580 [Bacteroidota bacterium]